ncbi:MAG: hypothetical protein KJ646_01295 [Nanoarchaeota archaeon]|nr:hypothetical protein [Nanoarchaeota archaeon]
MSNKLKHILIISAVVLTVAVFVVALTNEEIGAELAQPEGELIDANYPSISKSLYINYLFIYINLEFNYEIE